MFTSYRANYTGYQKEKYNRVFEKTVEMTAAKISSATYYLTTIKYC